jgi:glycosyltransferase involved in cell wall biosynthesis
VAAGLVLPAALFLVPALWRLWRVTAVLRGRARLPRASAASPFRGSGGVSVLVPARNEERNVGACLDSLSRQTVPGLEIIVIDDGSTDRTPSILDAAARWDARVRILRVDGPPPGWTGKNFALDAGVAVARGEWLCFTDADTVHAPESIGRAVGFAEAHGLALLSLTSRQLTGSFWERVIQPVVFGLLDQWFPLARVNDPASPLAAANGIFIVMSRAAYQAAGGHRAVAGEILEDVALARRVKAGGGRIAFVDGADLVAARMYTDLAAIRRGWTKNLYRLRGRRPLGAVASILELGITLVWPAVAWAGAALGGPAGSGWLAALGLGVILGAEVRFRARRGEDPRWSPTVPLGAALVAFFLLESAFRDWAGLGVHWKGRRYT